MRLSPNYLRQFPRTAFASLHQSPCKFLVPGLVKPGGRTCFIPSSSDRYKVARLAEKLQHPLFKAEGSKLEVTKILREAT